MHQQETVPHCFTAALSGTPLELLLNVLLLLSAPFPPSTPVPLLLRPGPKHRSLQKAKSFFVVVWPAVLGRTKYCEMW